MAELTSVTTIENKIYIEGQYENRQNCECAECRMNEQFQNLLIFGIFIIFQIKKKI